MTATRTTVAQCKARMDKLDLFLHEVGADTAEIAHAVALHPVARTKDLNPSEAEVHALAAPFQQHGLEVVVRGGTQNLRLFAYPSAANGSTPPRGAFLWAPVHSGLGSWWLMTTWRMQQMAHATIDLADRGLVLPAAACARSVLETAAAARYDTKRWTDMWSQCRQYSPTDGEPVPSSLFQGFHNYVVEMLVGGKFKGELPRDIRMLSPEPVSRTNIQTCLDHLSRSDPRVTTIYDVLCNAVHPSVASTLSFVDDVDSPQPGEVRMRLRRSGAVESAVSGGLTSTWEATLSGVEVGLEVAAEALDTALRAIDDLCLTVKLGQYKHADHWRCIPVPKRNERCPCRSGKKAKDCLHSWG